MKVILFLRDKTTGEKSEMEFQGPAETIEREIDQAKMFLTRHKMELLDWEFTDDQGVRATMGEEQCTVCGKPSSSKWDKIVKTDEGITISRMHLALCDKDFNLFTSNPKERARIITLGVEMFVAAPS